MRHPIANLSAYLEDQLPLEEAQQVAGHLLECRTCRDSVDEIFFGMRLVRRLPVATAPYSLWPLDRTPTSRPRMDRPPLAWVGVTFLVMLALPVWYFLLRPALQVAQLAGPPSELERLALEQHLQNVNGAPAWSIVTADAAELRRWVESGSGLSLNIPVERPPGDRIRLVGARLLDTHKNKVAEVGYVVDGRPVTLLTTRLTDHPKPPGESRLHKDVVVRRDGKTGYKTLAWFSDGQAYAMTSNLPGNGQQGCYLCHLTDDGRRLISRVGPLPLRRLEHPR